jgi:hypothetical protein
MTIRFTPLSTPLHRRTQTAVVLWHMVTLPCFTAIFFVFLGVPFLWPITIPYMIYFFLDKTYKNGGVTKRYSERMRNLKIWKYFVDYFPISLYKTYDLEPTFTQIEVTDDYYNFYLFKIKKKPYKTLKPTGPNYIFGLHPHGVASLSGFGAIATNGAGWSKKFPGIRVCLLTLVNQFQVPFCRDYMLMFGITSASRINALKTLKAHFSLAIVIGGAQESLLAKPKNNDIVLQKRKGFVKLGLETGNVGLVPCYCFGENNLYEILQPEPNSFGEKVQVWLKRNFGFTLPFFHARGIFNYDFGFLPYREKVTIVTGKPIIVPFLPSPTRKEVDYYHDLYITELKRIFDEYKDQFDASGKHLNIVE